MSTVKELRARWKREPGLSIEKQIGAFFGAQNWSGAGKTEGELRDLLEFLPFREEVPEGKDLRGVDIGAGRDLDMRGYNFSHARIHAFYNCDLSSCCFDDVLCEGTLSSILTRSTFRRAKLKSSHFFGGQVQQCIFDEANLLQACFQGSDLTGSSFRGANLKNANLKNTNLVGCDFRGAILDGAELAAARIDKSTDFRGASLRNLSTMGYVDEAYQVTPWAFDIRQATYDETTVLDDDLRLPVLDELKAAIRDLDANVDYYDEKKSARLRGILEEMQREIGQQYRPDWYEEVVRRQGASDAGFVEEVFMQTYRYMDEE